MDYFFLFTERLPNLLPSLAEIISFEAQFSDVTLIISFEAQKIMWKVSQSMNYELMCTKNLNFML